MRTIKFRAFVETHNGKEMVNDWCFLNEKDNHFHAVDLTNERPDIGEVYAVMQFTGLHDKNGKEIYEGDICKWSSWFLGSYQEINGDKIISLVEWSNKKGKWFVKNDVWDLGIYSDIEVIGNIYENPELL